MYLSLLTSSLTLFRFAAAAALYPDQIEISIHVDAASSADVEANDPPIVPLHPRARTGLLDPIYEEGLISTREYIICEQDLSCNTAQLVIDLRMSSTKISRPTSLELRIWAIVFLTAAQPLLR